VTPAAAVGPALPARLRAYLGRRELRRSVLPERQGQTFGNEGLPRHFAVCRAWHGAVLDAEAVFRCRPYGTGYTFATFLTDILPYLTEGRLSPSEMPAPRDPAEHLCELLRQRIGPPQTTPPHLDSASFCFPEASTRKAVPDPLFPLAKETPRVILRV
jgi:hypothetical protein